MKLELLVSTMKLQAKLAGICPSPRVKPDINKVVK
jgi:hypothetical protein